MFDKHSLSARSKISDQIIKYHLCSDVVGQCLNNILISRSRFGKHSRGGPYSLSVPYNAVATQQGFAVYHIALQNA